MPIACWPRMSWIRLSRSSMCEPEPSTRIPEPSFTFRLLRISKPAIRTQLRSSMSTMLAPGTPVPSSTGLSPG